MDLATISMERDAARRAFLDYRRAVRERHDQEDAQIMRGYRALARGQQLIRLSDTLHAGRTTQVAVSYSQWEGHRRVRREVTMTVPRLAVARADVRTVWTRGVGQDGSVEILYRRDLAPHNRRDRFMIRGFDEAEPSWRWVRAIVPVVPPPLRPAHALHNYLILWEAEWAPDPVPPVDPALLKHIGGDLYAVVAIWDLTELERAVLAARA